MNLSSIFKNAPCLAWIKDRNGVYIDVNYAYANYLSTTPELIIGKTDFDIWDKEQAEEFRKQDEYVMKERRLCKYSNFIEINNKRNYQKSSKLPYTDLDNKIVLGSLGIAMITNDKVELRRNIEKNENLFKEIANTIEDILIIQDEKKALYISPAFERIYGVTPEELNLYEDMSNWYSYWDSVEFEESDVDLNYWKREADKYTFKVTKKGQDDIWLMSSFAPIFDEDGNILRKVGIISDITQKKQEQNELDNLKMDFFVNISHELRTPINLILSALQLLISRNSNLGEEGDFYNKYCTIIYQNGLRLLKLVNNLIDTTKIDSGNFKCSPENNDIISCVENICMSVADFIESNNMRIIFDTNVEEKQIAFDEDNMERIMLNLLSNAIKYNKTGGVIEVKIHCDDKVKISVKDSGMGIASNKLETIFRRFEQAKSKFKTEREGSGIGLSLVKSLVEMHGGEIEVESELDKGTIFTVILPDKLIDDEVAATVEGSKYLNHVNRMSVEFSDIYM